MSLKLIGLGVTSAATVLAYFVWIGASESLTIDQKSRMPAPPEIAATQFSSTDSATEMALPEDIQTLFSPTHFLTEVTDQNIMFGLESDNLPILWALQVGNARGADEANQTLLRLRNLGFKAYIQTVSGAADSNCFIYVGPKIDRRKLLRDKLTIDRQFAVTSTVVRYAR